jgi:hydroxyacylglutathione hydrolase
MLEIATIPCLRDNYAYLLVDRGRAEAIVVDPSEAGPVAAELELRGLRLVRALATHHHMDHVGGAPELCARFGVPLELHAVDAAQLGALGVRVVGHEAGPLEPFGGAAMDLAHVPGHTLGAACFAVREAGALPRLFTGDTLFLAGCGRVFEGDPPMLRASLGRIAELAPEALLYCGHEYTASNLAFACVAEPANALAHEALTRAREAACTMPGRLSVERAVNPFLRTRGEGSFVLEGRKVEGDADAVFTALRAAKNVFRAP